MNLHFKAVNLNFIIFSSPFPFFSLDSKEKLPLCIHCWKWTGFFGSWRLSFPYVALGVALIMWPHNLWLSHVGGVLLIVLAMLRMFTIFRTSGRGREDSLLPEFDSDKYVFKI
jgi:Transmembrane protein family 72